MSNSFHKLSLRPALAATLLLATGLAGATAGIAMADSASGSVAHLMAPGPAAVAAAGAHASLADLVQAVGPSVVQIQVDHPAKLRQMSGSFGEGDLENRLGQMFGLDMPNLPGQQLPSQHALGSGFIINSTGLVLTNNHVIDGATKVKVQLSDGREMAGKVLGRDPKTDVAVIKIEGTGHFQAIQWGDSDKIRVGESVFAVGSPFGLGNTVTAGILSARGRTIGAGPYDDFLQVDAAINSGNSGGPLFDAEGRVIGINTAIFSPSGGNVGIGFAIPADMARRVAQQIVEHGHIDRGRIGVTLQSLTPEVAQQLDLKATKGALIAGVEQGGPAAAAGLASGDIVETFGGKPISDSRALARAVADAKVGSRVPVTVLRDGRSLSFSLPIGNDADQSS